MNTACCVLRQLLNSSRRRSLRVQASADPETQPLSFCLRWGVVTVTVHRGIDTCRVCGARKGKRNCPRENGPVCSACCGETRSWQRCPIDCRSFPEERGRNLSVRNLRAYTDSGDRLAALEWLYVPNLYKYTFCNLTRTTIEFLDAQRARVQCRFTLDHAFATDPGRLLVKEDWKWGFYPEGCAEHHLLPLLGIALCGQGLPDIESIRLRPGGEVRIGGHHWLIVPPFQRPLFRLDPDGEHPETDSVLSMGIRNAMIFAPLRFGVEYELELVVMDLTALASDGDLKSRIGLVLPYGRLQLSPPTVVPPPGSAFRRTTLETLTPAPAANYPGEQFSDNGVQAAVVFCRNVRDQVQGLISTRGDISSDPDLFAVLSEGPSSQLLTMDIAPSGGLQAALLQHSRLVNARLVPTLRNWLGPIGCPLQVAIINPGENSESVRIEETNQNSGARRFEVCTVAPKSVIHVPLELPGLGADTVGAVSLAVELSATDGLILATTASLQLLPADHLILRIEDDVRDWYRETVEAVVCWVTPHSRAVDEWVSEARTACADGMGAGSGVEVDTQVEALWTALKNRSVSYVNSSYSIDTGGPASYQRVMTPLDVLHLGYGNCIDLTVLFASALEKLGFRPAVITTTGHAFFGWLDEDGHVEGALETTMIAHAACSEAIATGMNELGSQDEFLKGPNNRILDVVALRGRGLMPLFD